MQWIRCSIYALLLPFLQGTHHLLHVHGHSIHLEVVISSVAAVACFGPQQPKCYYECMYPVIQLDFDLSWNLGALFYADRKSNLKQCIAPTVLELSVSKFVLTGHVALVAAQMQKC